MATVVIEDSLYSRLESRAQALGVSVEDEVRQLLETEVSARPSPRERKAALLDLIEHVWQNPVYVDGRKPDSTEMIRQMREEEEIDLMRVVRGER